MKFRFVCCPCFAHCRHDPIIVRTASNFSSFPRFHSVCASVWMFAINVDNCLFQFLQPRRHIHCQLTSGLCSSKSGLHPATESFVDFVSRHLAVESGIFGRAKYQSCDLNNIAILKQRLAAFQYLRNFFPSCWVHKHCVHLLQDELQVLYSTTSIRIRRRKLKIDRCRRDFRRLVGSPFQHHL